MSKLRLSQTALKKTYKRLVEQEKDLRVEVVLLRESLLFAESQFFYRIFHFVGFLIRDLKEIFVKNKLSPPLKLADLAWEDKIKQVRSNIKSLTKYRNKLIFVSKSPFIALVFILRALESILFYIPRLIEKHLINTELASAVPGNKQTDILNFAVIPYHFRRLRQQHLVEELAKKGERVFYIENRFLPQSKDKPLFTITKECNNVYIVQLSCPRDIAIYHQVPTSTEIKAIVESLKAFMKNVKIIHPLAKIDHPFWTYLLPHLKMPVIYDCMDDYAGFDITGEHILKLEKELVKNSDLTVVCSEILLKNIKKYKPRRTSLVKNACQYEHFEKASIKKDTCSAGLCWVKQPVIGFFGAIGEWIDARLVEKIALAFPQASIVMIGEVQNSAVLNVGERLPNVFLLGEKPYSKLPEYLQTFDICIIPFAVNKHTTLIDPVKMYEYFAAGKAVVTTSIAEIARFKRYMYFSKNDDDFIRNISAALKEKNKSLMRKRQEIAKLNTWKVRSDLLYGEVQRLTKDLYNSR